MKLKRIGVGRLAGCLLLIVCQACTEAGKTTGVGAATGGAIGAGVGAIVGNQTGDAGSGLALGMVAGAGTGAAIGNALEAQEKTIRTQDEAIERQGRLIDSQKNELEQLRRMSDERMSYKGSKSGNNSRSYASRSTVPLAPARSVRSSNERNLPAAPPAKVTEPTGRGSYSWKKSEQVDPVVYDRGAPAAAESTDSMDTIAEAPKNAAPKKVNTAMAGADCAKAEQEIREADRVTQTADRLFHYRRALRLCPKNPAYHQGLGEIYMSLDRKEDAEFEFQEALKLDPSYSPASDQLAQLGNQ